MKMKELKHRRTSARKFMNEPQDPEAAETVQTTSVPAVAGAAPCSAWGVVWRSENKRDGVSIHLLRWRGGTPALFRTRRGARDWIIAEYGYIRTRADLRAEPHGWRLPIAIKVTVSPNTHDMPPE